MHRNPQVRAGMHCRFHTGPFQASLHFPPRPARLCLPVFVVALAVAASACWCANLLRLQGSNCMELRSSR